MITVLITKVGIQSKSFIGVELGHPYVSARHCLGDNYGTQLSYIDLVHNYNAQ